MRILTQGVALSRAVNVVYSRFMSMPQDLGPRLRDARIALGLTQTQAAEGIVSGSFLSLIESGQRTPSPQVAAALAARLRVPIALEEDSERAMAAQIEVALRLGDWHAADEYLGSLMPESPEAWYFRGLVAEQRGDLREAVSDLNAAAIAASASPDLKLRSLVALCRCSRIAGDLFRSIEVGERAMALADSNLLSDELVVGELRATLSGAYCETGDLLRARELTVPRPSDSEGDPWQRATRLWARAMVLQTAGESAEARAVIFEALDLLRSLDRPRTTARLQNTAAWIAMQTEDFDTQELDALLRGAESSFRTNHAPIDLAMTLSSRAELAIRSGEPWRAKGFIVEALELAASGNNGYRARITALAAQIYTALGESDYAMRLLLQARQLLEEGGANRSAAATWRQLAHTYEQLGQLDLVVACLKAATDLLGLQPSLQVETPITSSTFVSDITTPRM